MPERKAMVRNAGNAEQVKRAKEREGFTREQDTNDLRFLLHHPQGRRFMWRLLGLTHVYDSIFVTSSEIYYKAGQQDIGHWLQKEIDAADPHAFVQMMREAGALEANKVEPSPSEEEPVA